MPAHFSGKHHRKTVEKLRVFSDMAAHFGSPTGVELQRRVGRGERLGAGLVAGVRALRRPPAALSLENLQLVCSSRLWKDNRSRVY